MNASRILRPDRRNFLAKASAVGAAGLLGINSGARAEPPPETTRIRLVKMPAICLAPEYIADDLLRSEGFTQIEYVPLDRPAAPDLLMADLADVTVDAPPLLLPELDSGKRVVVLAGIHGGCYELFGNDRVHAIRDLKGKRVAVTAIGGIEYYYIASMVAYVGMNPLKDIEWSEWKSNEAMMQSFIDGKADALLAFPPQPQHMRAKKIGRIIVNTAQDRPWDQYYCCLIAARPEFVSKYPVAAKRALRAILKATDICAREPERAARSIVAKGYESSYDIALEVVKSLSYNRWRTHNVEDSLRFFGVRLHEVGMIKSDPNKLIAQGTDWRFLNELKKELKA